MDTKGVLIEYNDFNDVYSSSGLLFGNHYILAPSNIFLSILNDIGRNDIEKWIAVKECGKLHSISMPETKKKIRVLTSREDAHDAEIEAFFYCKNIKNSTSKVLSEWCFDTSDTDKQLKDALSLFVILDIAVELGTDMMDIKESLFELLLLCENVEVERGSKIYTESTPFANRSFINSFSAGIVSNVIGIKDCFLLIDAPSAPGSEGGVIFGIQKENQFSNKQPLAVILASLTWWRGEYVGLSLCAKLYPLLMQLFPEKQSTLISRPTLQHRNEIMNQEKSLARVFNMDGNCVDSSVVQIFCGSSWGTGIILNIHKGLVITNSHVVLDDHLYKINIHKNDEKIPCAVVYKTPDTMVFDLAILKCKPARLKKFNIESTKTTYSLPSKGEEVLAVGFPFFRQNISTYPTISYGHVSSANDSILRTTCSVHPGASGGGIFRPNGELLGIIVCNTRLMVNAMGVTSVYPNINMSIPWPAVRDILEEFQIKEDGEILSRLCQCDAKVIREWSLEPSVASKL